MAPKMLSHPIEPLTFLYFTSLASRFDVGSVSSVSFARNFESVPVSLIGASFAIAAFPLLSTAFATGDRATFRRVFTTNLLTIAALTIGRSDRSSSSPAASSSRSSWAAEPSTMPTTARTATILAVFALAIPFESLTHLLARALYATRNTILPTIASVAGFVTTVLAAETLAPTAGLSAVPLGFAAGMVAQGHDPGHRPRAPDGRASAGRREADRRLGDMAGRGGRRGPEAAASVGRLAAVILSVALVGLAIGVIHATNAALAGATLEYAPVITPWARVRPSAPPPSVGAPPSAVRPRPSRAPAEASAARADPRRRRPRRPTPTPGPFEMDLYESGDYAGEFTDIWCVPAAMQTIDEHHGRRERPDEGDPAQRVQPRALARPRTRTAPSSPRAGRWA